ncbi:MAG: SAM-dependent methyltransferase, partial [Myxococcaceae bacterium]
GVELSRKRARRARNLQASWNGSRLVLLPGAGGGPAPDDAPDDA